MFRRRETFSNALSSAPDADRAFESDIEPDFKPEPGSDGGSGSAHVAAAGYPAPERPALPKPERLNRNALTVVAVIMGVLVLAAVVFVQPKNTAGTSQAVRVAPELAHGTFLDQPTTSSANSVANAVPSSGAQATGTPSGSQSQPGMGPIGVGSAGNASGSNVGATTGGSYSPYNPAPYAVEGSAISSAPVITAPHVDQRAEAYHAALEAPLVASEAASASAAQNAGQAASNAGGDFADLGGMGTVASAALPRRAFASVEGISSGRRELISAAARAHGTLVRTSVDPAPGPYAIQAGTLIPAVLMTEINSDLPGEVLAQVSRDVYDSRSEQALLIPKGSRLIGKYDNQVSTGQNRLLVAWTRVIFPDGRSVSLPGLETKDRAGAGGLHDQVDQHKGRVFGTAALLSLIGAGAQLAQPNGGYGAYGSYPSMGQIAAGAVGQQLSDVATQMLRRNMDAPPTIRIRQGMPFNVFLNADMTFPGPYTDQPGRFAR